MKATSICRSRCHAGKDSARPYQGVSCCNDSGSGGAGAHPYKMNNRQRCWRSIRSRLHYGVTKLTLRSFANVALSDSEGSLRLFQRPSPHWRAAQVSLRSGNHDVCKVKLKYFSSLQKSFDLIHLLHGQCAEFHCAAILFHLCHGTEAGDGQGLFTTCP